MNINLDHTHCLMHNSKGLCLLLLLILIIEFHQIGIQITLLYFIFDFERSYGLQFLINESFRHTLLMMFKKKKVLPRLSLVKIFSIICWIANKQYLKFYILSPNWYFFGQRNRKCERLMDENNIHIRSPRMQKKDAFYCYILLCQLMEAIKAYCLCLWWLNKTQSAPCQCHLSKKQFIILLCLLEWAKLLLVS